MCLWASTGVCVHVGWGVCVCVRAWAARVRVCAARRRPLAAANALFAEKSLCRGCAEVRITWRSPSGRGRVVCVGAGGAERSSEGYGRCEDAICRFQMHPVLAMRCASGVVAGQSLGSHIWRTNHHGGNQAHAL